MSSNKLRPMGPVEWALLIALSALFGSAFFFTKVALAELKPFTVVLGRVLIAAIVLNLVVVASGHRMSSYSRLWGAFLIMGAMNNLIPYSLIFWGQTQIASSLASMLNATVPLFTVVLAHFLTRDERITVRRLTGVLIGIFGVAVMLGPELLSGGFQVAGQVACLLAAVAYAFAGIFGRRFAGIPPVVTAAGQLTATSLMMTPIALVADRPWTLPVPTLQTWGAIAGLALISTAAAYVIYFHILAVSGATNIQLVALLMPATALVLGTVVLGEQLELYNFVGMFLIAAGLAIIDGRLIHGRFRANSSPTYARTIASSGTPDIGHRLR